jgi:hypothetical protein
MDPEGSLPHSQQPAPILSNDTLYRPHCNNFSLFSEANNVAAGLPAHLKKEEVRSRNDVCCVEYFCNYGGRSGKRC